MKLLVKYFTSPQESKTLDIEIDEKSSLAELNQRISAATKSDVIILPTTIKGIEGCQNLKDYVQKIQKDEHFIAIKRDMLSTEEQEILESFSLSKKDFHSGFIYAERFIHLLKKFLPEDLQQALAVRFADKVTMFGATFKDRITKKAENEELRFSMQMHPYPWLAAGAHNVLIYKDKSGELMVALVYNQRRDRRPLSDPLRKAGVPDFWKICEGYMHPKPCKGGEDGIALGSSDEMDLKEERILSGLSMEDAYKKLPEIETGDLIETLHFDASIKESGVREAEEELHLKLNKDQFHYVAQREENRIIPTVANVYYIPVGNHEVSPPKLQPDGIEIKEAVWEKVRQFIVIKDDKRPEKFRVMIDYYPEGDTVYSVEIPIKYAMIIGQAIRKYRDDEIQEQNLFDEYPLFSCRENVIARILQTLNTASLNQNHKTIVDILGPTPENFFRDCQIPGDTTLERNENLKAFAELGKLSEDYHKKILALAIAFKNAPLDKPLNADQLQKIADQIKKKPSLFHCNLHETHISQVEEREPIHIPKMISIKRDQYVLRFLHNLHKSHSATKEKDTKISPDIVASKRVF